MITAVQPAYLSALPKFIAVDLDGTLVRTDTFIVTAIESIRKSPVNLLRVLTALRRGKAECKHVASSIAHIDASVLPYNQELLAYLRDQHEAGRKLILATGADWAVADAVAKHLRIFDEVLSTEGDMNLVGRSKLLAIRAKLGDAPFSYAGNSDADFPIWEGSATAIVVGAPPSRAAALRRAGFAVEKELARASLPLKQIARSLRFHQWSKNILVFLPIMLSHRIGDPRSVRLTLLAVFDLSLLTSALYTLNDLMDLQADRVHPRKRDRPIASGAISIPCACAVALTLFIAAAGISVSLPAPARALLLGYAVAVFLYSVWLKRVLFLDVVSLAIFYTVRVLYGGAATSIPISVWTLACSLFLFTSLAATKRLTELRRSATDRGMQDYRGYQESDGGAVLSLAASAGYVSVLVLALYINSPDVALLYSQPQRLWLLCPLLVYWVSRICILANRGSLDDDPVTFALKDRVTWIVGVLCALIVFFSTR